MAQHGGYRRPETPAQFSGPGKFSQRTDGGPGETPSQAARYISGMPYGEAQEVNGVASAAPLAAAPTTQEVVPFDAPTRYPDEPVTAGVDFGEGAGSESRSKVGTLREEEPDAVAAVIRQAYAQFPSPHLRRLVEQLEEQGR